MNNVAYFFRVLCVAAAWGLDWNESGDVRFTAKVRKSLLLWAVADNTTPEELILKELGNVHAVVNKESTYFGNPAINDADKSKSNDIIILCKIV